MEKYITPAKAFPRLSEIENSNTGFFLQFADENEFLFFSSCDPRTPEKLEKSFKRLRGFLESRELDQMARKTDQSY